MENGNDSLRLENLDLKLALLQAQFQLVKKERDELAAKLEAKELALGPVQGKPGDSALIEAAKNAAQRQ